MAEKNSLWKNIRNKAAQNKRTGATPKKPTTEMIRQERKIKAKKAEGGPIGDDELYNMQRALELGYTPDETGHWPSVDSETGMFLKSKEHPTAWMEYFYGHTLNPELNRTTNVVVNPEGYFGNNQLQYISKEQKATGGYYPTQGPGKALFKGYDEGGYMYSDGGSKSPVKDLTYIPPTRQDSLDVFNNAIAVRAHYDAMVKKNLYKKPEIINEVDSGKTIYNRYKKGTKFNDELKKAIKDIKDDPTYIPQYKKYHNIDKSKVLNLIKEANENANYDDPYKVKIYDLYPSKVDIAAPATIIDNRISPQAEIKYNISDRIYNSTYANDLPGGTFTGIPMYDPIAIAPFDILNDEQKAERVKKYGPTGVPTSYTNPINILESKKLTSLPTEDIKLNLKEPFSPSKVLLREMGNVSRYNNNQPYKKTREMYMDDGNQWRPISDEEYEMYKKQYPGADTTKGWIQNNQKAEGGYMYPDGGKKKTYTNPTEFQRANRAYEDSLSLASSNVQFPTQFFNRLGNLRDQQLFYMNHVINNPNTPMGVEVNGRYTNTLNSRIRPTSFQWTINSGHSYPMTRAVYPHPKVKPVFEKPKTEINKLDPLKLTNIPTEEIPLTLKSSPKQKAYINRGVNSGLDANGNPLVSEINLGDGKGWQQVPYNTLDQYEEIKATGGYTNPYNQYQDDPYLNYAQGGYYADGGEGKDGTTPVKKEPIAFEATGPTFEVVADKPEYQKVYDEEYQKRMGAQKEFQESWYPGQEYDPSNIKYRSGLAAIDAAAQKILAEKNKFQYADRQVFLKSFNPKERSIVEQSSLAGALDPDAGSTFRMAASKLLGDMTPLSVTGINPINYIYKDSDISKEDYENASRLGIVSPFVVPLNIARAAITGDNVNAAFKGQTPRPWKLSSEQPIGMENVSAINTLGDIGIDPLNFTGIGIGEGLFNDVTKNAKKFFKSKLPYNNPRDYSAEYLELLNRNNQLPPPPPNTWNQVGVTPPTNLTTSPISNTNYDFALLQDDYTRMFLGQDPIHYPNLATRDANEAQQIILRNTPGFRQPLAPSTANYSPYTPPPIPGTNKSGLTRDQVLNNPITKDRDVISKMTDQEFAETVLKPNGEVIPYQYNKKASGVIPITEQEWVDEFNTYLDDLNDNFINDPVNGFNKSGIRYRIESMDNSGQVTVYTPKQTLADGTIIDEGRNVVDFDIESPGLWRGTVEDIPSIEYHNSIPGIRAFNTAGGIFPPRSGLSGTPKTGFYDAINAYIKKYDLGRVKDGASGQSRTTIDPITNKVKVGSFEVWDGNVVKDKAVGFYTRQGDQVSAVLRTLFPYAGIGGAGALYQLEQNSKPKQQAAGGYTMKNNNQSWRNYFQYAAGGPYNEEAFYESPFNNDKKRNTVLSNPLNEGSTYFKPAADWAVNWVSDPEYVTRLNENFPDRSKVTKLDTVFKSKQEARQDKRDTNLEGFAAHIPTLVQDINNTKFLFNRNPSINDQLYRDYSSSYTPEDTAEVKKELDKNPQAFTDPYGTAIVRNRANESGQAGDMSAGQHEFWHKGRLPASKPDMFGNRAYQTLDEAYAGKFATPHPSTWIPNSKGILKSPEKKEFYPMLMQIRMDNGFQPGEIIDDARLNQIRKSGSTNPLFKYYNNEQLKKYLNTFASNIPQSNPQEPYIQKAAQGGYINPYNQYANGGYMYGNGGRTWKNIGAGAFGLLEGVVDTTFGWIPGVDMATDLAYKGLQKLGNSTEDEKREQDSIAGYAQTAGAVGSAILTGGATTGTAIAEGAQGLGQGISKGNETSEVARGIGTGLGIAGGIVGAAYGSTKGAKEAKSAFKLSEAGSQGIGKFAASAPISGFSAAPKGTMQGVIDGNAVSMKPGTDAALSSVTPTASVGTFSSPDITNINAPNPVNKIADVTSAISDVPKSQEPPPMAPPVAAPQVPPPTPQVDYNQFAVNPPIFNTGVETPDFNYKPSFPTYSQGGNITNNSLNLRNTMRYKRFAQGGTFDQYGINMIPESAGLHHQSAYGGVPIGPDALAEGGEIKMDTGDGGQYIVSDQVDGAGTQKDFTFSKGGKYKELNRTLADGMKQDLNKFTFGSLATSDKVKGDLRRPNDSYAQSTIEQIKQKWQQKTEYARQRSQQEQVIAQAEEQKRMAEEQFIGAYGGKVSRKNYPNLNRAKGGYVHNQMTQPMLATGGPVYGDPASPYTYAYGGMYGDPYYRGGQIDYTNDMYSMYAGGGPMVGNAPQAFTGYAAQNRGGMLMNYADGGMMPSPEQQMMQEQQMQQAPQEQMPQQGGQEQMMQMVQQVMQALMQGANPEEIMQQLVQSGIPPEQAQQIIQVAMQEAQGQQQQQPMQGEQQMMPQQGMAQGGMMPQQEGVATQIAEQLQQGADPQQVLESLVQKGMPQQQAMAMLKAIMGQLKNQMQQQPQQQMMPQEQMAPQPMMARGGYFNGRKQYKNAGPVDYFSPLADESTMSKIAGLGQAVVPAVTSAYAFNNLSKRKLNPSLVENVKVDYTPERVALREEGRRGISMALDTMKRNAPTSASFMGNAGLAVLKGNKLVGSQISKSLQDEKNKQADYDYNIGTTNAGIRNKVNEANEEMYQNAMQSGFQAAGQGVKNVASYYGDLENRKLQRWQAMNTSGEDWHWTPKGKAFRNKDGKWYDMYGKEMQP